MHRIGRFLFGTAVAALITAPIAFALDLTPTKGVRDLEGFSVPIVTFRDGTRTVRWQPPLKWNLSPGPQRLDLSPDDTAQAALSLELRELKAGATAPEKAAVKLADLAKELVPKDATDVVFLSEAESPFTLNGVPSHECTFGYAAFGRRFRMAVAIVDLNPRERLVVCISAREKDFEKVHADAIASFFSWTWIE